MSSDDLATRPGLPEAYRYLLADLPRDRWHGHEVAAMARFWLQIHSGLRREESALDAVTARWSSGQIDLATLHNQLIPTLQQFLQHLDFHHRVESHQYFPIMRRVEPRIAAGIDLLDRDHDAIHERLEAMVTTGTAFHQAMASKAPDAADAAARLADVLDEARRPLLRHLADEEEIVVPLITRHIDAFPA